MTLPIEQSPAIKFQRHPLDELCINTIRTLAMDAVQAANSGHPGTPMAMAPVAYYLWQYVLRFDPEDPIWPNRDRFVLSAGHASMLLYSMLHLTGVKAVNAKIRSARRAVGAARRHQGVPPARQHVPGPSGISLDVSGVETTTGPLGQGFANSVGMAIAGKWMAAHFNRPDFDDVRLQRLRPVRRRLHDGRHLQRGGVARRASQARQPLLDLRQQPHHHRRATPHWPSAKTWRRASSATAGTSRASATPTISSMLERAFRRSLRTRDRPTLIIVDSHIG